MLQRTSYSAPGPFLALVVAIGLSISGCLGGYPIMTRQQQLKQDVSDAKTRAGRECAPEELARAEAHLAFAQLEMQQGSADRADKHLMTGDVNVKLALKKIVECEKNRKVEPTPTPPKDTDGDGFVDSVDACRDDPEDFDGVEDDDGCPEGARDRDGDGIADDQDRCPDVPEDRDGVEDSDGCPDITADRDGDGIADNSDKCPDQAEDRDGFQDEDGCPEIDNDNDGIFDIVDRCPNDPEDPDGFEDQDGCPEKDNDHDGIADGVDRCPTEPETVNEFEDQDGCPDTKPELPSRVTITSEQIRISEQIKFKTASDVILKDSYGILDDVAKVLKAYPKIKIRIEGHTDAQGTEVYNLDLSKRRAASVRRYMENVGIDSKRLSSVGLGESQPIDDNGTEAGRANNRRVEFHITEQ